MVSLIRIGSKIADDDAKKEADNIAKIARSPVYSVDLDREIDHLKSIDFTDIDNEPLLIDKVFLSSQTLKESALKSIHLLNWQNTEYFEFAVMPMQLQSHDDGILMRFFVRTGTTFNANTRLKIHGQSGQRLFSPKLQNRIGKISFIPQQITFVDILVPAHVNTEKRSILLLSRSGDNFLKVIISINYSCRGEKPTTYKQLVESKFIDIATLPYITPKAIKQIISIISSNNKLRKVKIGFTSGTLMFFTIGLLLFVYIALFNVDLSDDMWEMLIFPYAVFGIYALVLIWITSIIRRLKNLIMYGLFSFNSKIPNQRWIRDYCNVSEYWNYEDWKKNKEG